MEQEEKDILKMHMVDAFVKVANSYGYCDAVGVLRGTLFLADRPVSMDELVEETGYSKSTVSANMNTLERRGLAKRVVVPGDKRYYYIPVTETESLKKQMIINMREEMQTIIAAMKRTQVDLKAHGYASETMLNNIERARRFYMETDRLLDLISRYNIEDLIHLLEKDLQDKKHPENG